MLPSLHPSRNLPAWGTFIVLVLFSLFQLLMQGTVGIMAESLQKTQGFSAKEIAYLSSSFFYTYVLFQIPAGMVLDRFGIRKVMVSTSIMLSIGCLALSCSTTLFHGILSRAMMGFGASFGFVSMLYSIRVWFGPKRFPILMPAAQCMTMVGMAILNIAFAKLVTFSSWKTAMAASGGIAFLLFVLICLLVKDPEVRINAQKTPVQKNALSSEFKKLLYSQPIWNCCLFVCLIYSLMTVFIGMWAVPFLMQTLNTTLTGASSIVSMVYIGMACACPFMSWFSLKFRLSSIVCGGAFLCSLFSSIIIFFPHLPPLVFYALMFALGASLSSYQLSYAIISNHVPNHLQGTALGVANMFSMIGGPLIQPIIGWLLTRSHPVRWSLEPVKHDYQKALWVVPMLLVLSWLLSLFMRDQPSGKN